MNYPVTHIEQVTYIVHRWKDNLQWPTGASGDNKLDMRLKLASTCIAHHNSVFSVTV
jgi:hypothetical protein